MFHNRLFFGDYALASLLFRWQDALKSSEDLEAYIEAVEYYVFGERLDQLVANVAEYVDEYERYAVQHAPGYVSVNDQVLNRSRYHNFSQATKGEIEMALTAGSLRSMHVMWPKFSFGRHILRLFVAPAEVAIDQDGQFRATCPGHAGHIDGSAIDVARPVSKGKVSGQGSVEAVLLTPSMKVAICVFFGHELVATVDVATGKVNDADSATACDRLSSYLALEAASVEILRESRFREGSRAYELASRLRARAREKNLRILLKSGSR
jgi:hypothetical protein